MSGEPSNHTLYAAGFCPLETWTKWQLIEEFSGHDSNTSEQRSHMAFSSPVLLNAIYWQELSDVERLSSVSMEKTT